MAVTQYIGSRYVPIFADPVEWSSAKEYEPLTIVLHEGNSFTSKQFVPVGIDITNNSYWAETGNYNAQVEQYRRETQRVSDSLDNVNSSITTINSSIPISQFSDTTVKDYIDSGDSTLDTKIDSVEQDLDTRITNLIETNDYTEITTTDKDYFPFGDTVGIPSKPETIVFGEDGKFKQAIYNSGYNFWATGVLDVCNMVAVANTYLKNYTNFVYGGSYNAMCLQGTYDDPHWLDPKQYKDDQNRMRIECNAFAQLIGHGVTFQNSTYSGTNTNNSMRHPMFNYMGPSVKPYMLFGQRYVDEFAEEGVILQSWEFAKMLYDAGKLEPVPNIQSAFLPGYLYFSGNASDRFLRVSHCFYIGGFLGDSADAKIVIESIRSFPDGYGIGCRTLENAGYIGETHGRYLPPFNGGFIQQRLGNSNNYYRHISKTNLENDPINWNPAAATAGAAVLAITVNGATGKDITFRATYARDENQNIEYNIPSLTGSYVVVIPYGYSLNVSSVSENCSVEVVEQIVCSDKCVVIPERSS